MKIFQFDSIPKLRNTFRSDPFYPYTSTVLFSLHILFQQLHIFESYQLMKNILSENSSGKFIFDALYLKVKCSCIIFVFSVP